MRKGKVGFYGGKFLPLHQGHVYMIIRAACMVDELYVVLSYSKIRDKKLVEKGNIKELPFEVRLRWLSQLTKDMGNVKVIAVEDTADSDETYDWKQGADDIKKTIGKPIDVVFGSEEGYHGIFKALYPDAHYEMMDPNRNRVPISATQIRTDGPFAHWTYIPDVVKPYFVKTVAIVGTESCGKSTLTRYLAKLFNTTYTAEYGRTLTDELGGCEHIMTKEDYYHIQYGHKLKEEEAKKKANKVTFIDSEAVVTQYFAKLYMNEQYPLIDEIIQTQKYDLWLFLEPDVEWVDDGTRSFGEEKVRQENNRLLKHMLKERNIAYNIIKGDYDERLDAAYRLVEQLLKEPKKIERFKK